MQSHQYDAVVIGAGSGGLTTAVGLSKVGQKVLLIEQVHMGGECTNTGCVPSKALLHYAKLYHQAKKLAGTTKQTDDYRQNALIYVRSKIAEVLAEETASHFEELGINVIMGEARFTGKNSVTVSGQTYTFKKAIIATGSKPRPLTIEGLSEEKVLTNQNIFELEAIPARLLIIGAGPIGLELGQAFAMLGSTVTIIDNGDRLARLEDEAISPIIESTFKELGISVFHQAEVTRISNSEAFISIKDTKGNIIDNTSISFDKTLIAIGRLPNLPSGLEEAGIITTPQGITVNQNWQTSNKKVYALGDVAAKLKFTHVADDTARQVVLHIVSHGLVSVKTKQVPKVTYTEPEMAQVGLSWTEALEIYGNKKLHRIEVSFSANDRARTDDSTEGLVIIIAKRLSGQIVGAHIIGPRAGELISTLTLAMENNISLFRLRNTIFAYPTYSLILKKAADYFLVTQISSLKTDLLNLAKSIAPKIIAALIWISALIWLYLIKTKSGLSFGDIAINLFSFITNTAWGPLLYIAAYTVRPLVFFPGTALTILSGIFFGLPGIIYTIIGANLSATVAYLVGRFFSVSTGNNSPLRRYTDLLHKKPFMTILTMRLTFFPYDVVNYSAGLLRLPYTPFILATIIGTLLGISTFVAIGSSLSVEEFIQNGISKEAVNIKFISISVVIFIASHLVASLVKRP